jgi:hypothetical protein
MYIDPNTGGVLFQALAGAFVVISGVLLVFSGKIRGYFAQMRRKSREAKEEHTETQE